MYIFIIIIPILACWLAAFLISRFLYYPVRKTCVAGIKIQGLVPGFLLSPPREIIAAASSAIKSLLAKSESLQHVPPAVLQQIERHIQEFLQLRLKEKIPVVATFLGEKTLNKIREALMEEIEIILPEVISNYAASMLEPDALLASMQLAFTEEKLALLLQNTRSRRSQISGRIQLAGLGLGLLIAALEVWAVKCIG